MATSSTTKVPYVSNSSRDNVGQFNSLDAIIDFDEEAAPEIEQTPEQRRQEEAEQRVEMLKRCLGGWRVAGGVLGVMMVLGWICIIAVLILEEKWQLVLIAWLLLYAAAHFCYWYFSRHSLLTLNSQLRERFRMGNGEKPNDHPPTYDEVVKSEAPPPAYYSVVEESPKGLDKIRMALKSTGAIPKVFKIGSSKTANLQEESSSERKSSDSLAASEGSLFTIEQHYAGLTNNGEGRIPNMLRATSLPGEQTHDTLPPSYDSINFETNSFVDLHPTSRRLSKIAVDIEDVQ